MPEAERVSVMYQLEDVLSQAGVVLRASIAGYYSIYTENPVKQ